MKQSTLDKLIRVSTELKNRLDELISIFQEEKNEVQKQELHKIIEVKTDQKDRLIPVTQWNKYHAWPAVGGLRSLIFFSNINGFDKVVKRCGRRVLIDEKAFFEWVKSGESQKKCI